MNNLTLLYFGIGCIIVLVKCIILLFMNVKKYYLTPNGVTSAIITFIIDIFAWPLDIIYTIRYLVDKRFRNEVINNIEEDRTENGY